MSKQKLNRAEIAGPSVYEGRLGAAQGVSAVERRVQDYSGDPAQYKPVMLAGRDPSIRRSAAGKQEITRSSPR